MARDANWREGREGRNNERCASGLEIVSDADSIRPRLLDKERSPRAVEILMKHHRPKKKKSITSLANRGMVAGEGLIHFNGNLNRRVCKHVVLIDRGPCGPSRG